MKTIKTPSISSILFATIVAAVFYSCKKNSNSNVKTDVKSPISVTDVNNETVKQILINWQNNNIGKLMSVRANPNNGISVNSIDKSFDYSNLKLAIINSDTAIVASVQGAKKNTPYGYFAGFYTSNSNSTVNSALIIRVDSLGKDSVQNYYFSPNNALLLTMGLNIKTGVSSVIYTSLGNSSINAIGKVKVNGCGQATSGCIGDAYLNHGWASVWAFVQTAYIPQTALLIAAACAGKNCFGKD